MLTAHPLLDTLVAALVLAFLFALAARALRLPPIVGYLVAGIAMGPHTPGFVGDLRLAQEMAEIGVILLMFGVGLHFSVRDLMAVRSLALPGALILMAITTALGWGLARALGWSHGAGLIFGFAHAVASTVVLMRALQDDGRLNTTEGQIAVGWLVVEDMAMVLALVVLPAVARLLDGGALTGNVVQALAITLAKVAVFIALMAAVGSRVLPWLLSWIGGLRSRELFSLGALAIALGIAWAAASLFGASFALGAFLAGLTLGRSTLAQKAAEQTLPLRDAFSVIFFVAVGMLFDPRALLADPLPLLATLGIVLVAKSAVAYAIARAFGHGRATALTVAAALSQIGEFSFVLAAMGVATGLLPAQAKDLILATAMISIALNPAAMWLARRHARAVAATGADPGLQPAGPVPPAAQRKSGLA